MPTYIEFEIGNDVNEEIVDNRSVVHFVREENDDNQVLIVSRLVFLLFGLLANLLVGMVIVTGSRTLHTTANCYVLSILVSDVLVILEILLKVLKRWFIFLIHMDEKYVAYVTLEASMVTIVIFAIERYVTLCLPISGSWPNFGFSNGIKSILTIWSFAATFSAMELDIDLHFVTNTRTLIFVISTTMFLVLPTLVVIALVIFILLDGRKLKNNHENETSKVFLSLVTVFYVSMAPHRIMSLVCFTTPTLCSSQTILNVIYLIVELSAAVNPILYCFVSKHFRTAFKDIIKSFCTSNRSTDNQVM